MAKLDQEQINELLHGVPEEESNESAVESEEVEAIEEQSQLDMEQPEISQEEEQEEKHYSEMTEDEKLDLATKQGFNPNFKGDHGLGLDEFLEKNMKDPSAMEKTIYSMQNKMNDMMDAFKRREEQMENRYKREMEEKIAQIRAKKTKMEQDGLLDKSDFDTYNKLNAQEAEINAELQQPQQPPQQQPQAQQLPVEIQQWAEKNKHWYGVDAAATAAADGVAAQVGRMYPHLSIAEKLQIAENEMRKVSPHLFENPKRKETPRTNTNLQGAASAKGSVKTPKSFGFKDLRPEDKKDYKIWKGQNWGLRKAAHETKEQFEQKIKHAEAQYFEDMAYEYSKLK